MNYNKHVWEGWLVKDFINDLEPIFNMIQNNQSWIKKFTKSDESRLKQWCIDNQSYYKKHIPEVFNYFKKRL